MTKKLTRKSLTEKYDWRVEPKDEDWSDDTYAYFLIHINIKRMAEYLYREFKRDWWFKADFGQDYVWIVAENNNYPVRLFFNFYEGGWADIVRHYTDGSSYKDENLGDWHYAKYDVEDAYNWVRDSIEGYFDKFEESKKSVRKVMKESGYYDWDMTVKQWFDRLDDLFNFRRLVKNYFYINAEKLEDDLIKNSMNYAFDFESFIHYLRDELRDSPNCVKFIEELEKYGRKYLESKKSVRKSKFTESAKPINERNVIKFVEELNQILHDEYDDLLNGDKDIYDFKKVYLNRVGDTSDGWLIYDYNGAFDWYEDKYARKIVDELLRKYGWYGEPCSSYSEFCIGEL